MMPASTRATIRVGERVVLRYPVDADRREFLRMIRRSRRLHRPWVYPPDKDERFVGYVRHCDTERYQSYLVCLRRGGEIVGGVSLSEIVRGVLQSAYLGYYGHLDYANQGLMTEGVGLAVTHAFRVLRLHRVEANIQPGNDASIALIRRCGFRKEGFSPSYLKIGGRWRDHERWAVLADEWR